MFKHACKTGLEGVVSKVRDSQYGSNRNANVFTLAGRVSPQAPTVGRELMDYSFQTHTLASIAAALQPGPNIRFQVMNSSSILATRPAGSETT
jgi:hypothetical protein